MTQRMLSVANNTDFYQGPVGSFLGTAAGFTAGVLIQPVRMPDSGIFPLLGAFDGATGWLLVGEYRDNGPFELSVVVGDSVGGPRTITGASLNGTPGQLMWCCVSVAANGDVRLTLNGAPMAASGVVTTFLPAPAGERMKVGASPVAPFNVPIDSALRFGGCFYHEDYMGREDLMQSYVGSQEYGRPVFSASGHQVPAATDPVFFDNAWDTADLLDGGPQIASGVRGVDAEWSPFSGSTPLTKAGADTIPLITIPEGREQWYQASGAIPS